MLNYKIKKKAVMAVLGARRFWQRDLPAGQRLCNRQDTAVYESFRSTGTWPSK